ncbi:ferredoxin [Candidatus Epulonipiscium fishelsonii]|nr:ferredoxin [Epulopiscium sp. SCG-C06WGA-EpuloA1]
MSITGILIAALIIGGTGLFIGIFLGVAGKTFAVEVDEREEAIMGVLPGNNCGGCGYPGCGGLASAIVKGEAEPNGCPVGGSDVAAQVASIMGKEASAAARMTAFVKCAGTCEKAKEDYNYYGISDCTMMNFSQNNGSKSCNYGCFGLGTCMKACPFNAIQIVNGVAEVIKENCKSCSKCVTACPKHLIEIVPFEQTTFVVCNSQDKGKDVMSACSAGCIGCRMCTKTCETNAITVENNIAHINYDSCINCGACAEKCPKKCIIA